MDQLISQEVAVLAKLKGFKPEREWNPEYVSGFRFNEEHNTYSEVEFQEEDWNIEGNYLRPTQTTLQTWLRNTHKIAIVVEPWTDFHNRDEYNFEIGYLCKAICFTKEKDGRILRDVISGSGAKTYEQTLEYALQAGLGYIDSPFRRKNKL